MDKSNLKQLITLALLAAMVPLTLLIRIPLMPVAAPFLTYDPKDVIIVIGGFMFGPLAAIMLAWVAALVEMPFSGTGPWGVLMNATSSMAFAVPAALIYTYKRTLAGAIAGLFAGILIVVPTMLMLNLFIVPLFMPWMTRADVAPMLVPVFLPFNTIKYGLNAVIAFFVYKPVVRALTAAKLFRVSQ
jgi:riboflavin transporter FmnP